jgi:hypothetical protein
MKALVKSFGDNGCHIVLNKKEGFYKDQTVHVLTEPHFTVLQRIYNEKYPKDPNEKPEPDSDWRWVTDKNFGIYLAKNEGIILDMIRQELKRLKLQIEVVPEDAEKTELNNVHRAPTV